MTLTTETTLGRLLTALLTPDDAGRLLGKVSILPAIAEEHGPACSRAVIAQGLNLALLKDLLDRLPSARAYLDDLAETSAQLVFDHGALRTVDLAAMGTLPAGEEAIARILRPLGYAVAETYPLDRLGMTGRSYRHLDHPEDIPQFFVSELHVDRFSAGFRAAASRVTSTSRDPLDARYLSRLAHLATEGSLPLEEARLLLPAMIACFGRQHAAPALADYEQLLAESLEMAWIATEGNAFNHATDRVSNLVRLAQRQRDLGRAIKGEIEISATGRVRQTAYHADTVTRTFRDGSGAEILRPVPGSFFEFIERDPLPDGTGLDLTFDTGNAQSIFRMTAAGAA